MASKAPSLEAKRALLRKPVQEVLDFYRVRYTSHVLRRAFRRLMVLACIALAFAGLARFLVLDSDTAYGSRLTTDSNVIDYIYSLGITASYSDSGSASANVAPVSTSARFVAVALLDDRQL